MKRRRRRAQAFQTTAAEVLEDRALLSASTLDTTFGGTGLVDGNNGAVGLDTEFQSDGKILVSGQAGFVARLNTDGTLDSTFGDDGFVQFSEADDGGFNDITVLPNDQILVALPRDFASNQSTALIRLNADGSVDSTFQQPFTDFTATTGDLPLVEVDSVGRIVAMNEPTFGSPDILVARFNSDGSVDSSFGTDGTTTIANTGVFLRDIEIDSSDRIVLATGELIRLNTDGSIDSTFSAASTATFVETAISDSGVIYAGGFELPLTSPDPGRIVAFDDSGATLASVTVADSLVTSLAVQNDGRLLAAVGTVRFDDFDATVYRFEADLTLDTSFGSPVVNPASSINDLEVDENNRIITTGFGQGIQGFFVARLTPGNFLPTANDESGSVTEDATPNTSTGNVLANDTDPNAGDTLTVSEVNGAAADVGNSVALTYGSVVINSDGSYTYTLDNNNAAVQALNTGETLTETISYTIADGCSGTATADLTIMIDGQDEPTGSTPLEQVNELIDSIFDIYNNGGISAPAGNWLLRTLVKARNAISYGQIGLATFQLRYLQTQVVFLYYTGQLGLSDAQDVFGAAAQLISDL